MYIAKLTNSSEFVRMFEYLSDVKETHMPDLGTFVIMCQKGRAYKVIVEDKIVGGLCMYETKDRIFVAFMHVNKNLRKSKCSVALYLQIVKYAQDKKKRVYTTMDDISQVKKFFTPTGMSGKDILYEIDTRRITKWVK